MIRLLVCAALLASCGNKSSSEPQANLPTTSTGDAATDAPVATGTVEVKVELRDPPAALVRSPGRNRCGGVRPPAVRVHHLFGLSGAVVWIEGAAGATAKTGTAEISIRDCVLSPRITLLPGPRASLDVINGDEQRRRIKLQRAGHSKVLLDAPLPLVGQRVPVTLDRPGTYRLTTGSAPDDPAHVVVAEHNLAGVTDRRGELTLTGVPAGEYQLVAWHPMGGDTAARTVKAKVTVEANETAKVTLSMTQ